MLLVFLIGCFILCTLTNEVTGNKNTFNSNCLKKHSQVNFKRSIANQEFYDDEINNQLNLKKLLQSKTENFKAPANNDIKAKRGVYFEFARERPSIFSNNYDLVGEWYESNDNNGENFLLSKFPQTHLKRSYYNYDKTESAIKSNMNEEEMQNTRRTAKRKQQNKTKSSTESILSEKTDRHKDRPTRRDRRRHAERGMDGWGWREGIFRETSRCVDIPKNMSLCSDIEYKFMRMPNLLAHDSLQEIIQQCMLHFFLVC